MEHTLVLFYLHHSQYSIAAKVLRGEMQRLNLDFWEFGIHVPHIFKIIGADRVFQNHADRDCRSPRLQD